MSDLSKLVAAAAVIIAFLFIYYLIDNAKEAYKLVPVETPATMEIPPFADWREFISQDSTFRVSLPIFPQNATEQVPIPGTNKTRKYQMYVSQLSDNSIYLISLITYPKDYELTNSALKQFVDELVATDPENVLETMQNEQFKGQEAIDFVVKNARMKIAGKAFLFNHTMYVLSYMATIENFKQNEYEHFINSFEILPGEARNAQNN